VDSSSISALAYDESTRTLGVRFRQGETYLYHGVPAALYRALMDAESLGGLFDRMVKQAGYAFERVDD
jgi:hypothetical protein